MGTQYPVDRRGRPIPDGSWPPGREAPGRLERLRRFVNTQNPESGADLWATPAELRDWLVAEGFAPPTRVAAGDLALACSLRGALLRMAIANGAERRAAAAPTGAAPPASGSAAAAAAAAAAADLDVIVAGLDLRARFAPAPVLSGTRSGVAGACADIVGIAMGAHLAGTWPRLKACGNEHCRWVVYDHSRNASSAWCATLVCGSRSKARAWRERNRGRR